MSIKFVSGNIFNYPGLDAFCHGCNCKGIMGAGIAAEVKKYFPEMFKVYRQLCLNREFILGGVFTASISDIVGTYQNEIAKAGFKTVYNLATQNNIGPNANLRAIEASVCLMIDNAEKAGIKTIGVPRLGAGIGGLDWKIVKEILEKLGSTTNVELIVLEEFVK